MGEEFAGYDNVLCAQDLLYIAVQQDICLRPEFVIALPYFYKNRYFFKGVYHYAYIRNLRPFALKPVKGIQKGIRMRAVFSLYYVNYSFLKRRVIPLPSCELLKRYPFMKLIVFVLGECIERGVSGGIRNGTKAMETEEWVCCSITSYSY